MNHHTLLQPLLSSGGETEDVLSGTQFQTAWHQFLRVGLEPGGGQSSKAGFSEIGYILLEGKVTPENDGAEVESPAVLKCPVSCDHRIFNSGDSMADLLMVSVNLSGPQHGSQSRFEVEAVNRDALKWRAAIHGGCGEIATRHIWSADDFISSWTFLDHAMLASDSSVGYHHHGGLEESFVILSGRGRMTVDDDTFEVEPGSVTFQGIEQGHGIYNSGDEPLAFLRIAVGVPGEGFTTIDLDDDLASRHSSTRGPSPGTIQA